MKWSEKEEAYYWTFQAGRQCKNLWKYIPAKAADAVDQTDIDCDGYWIYLKDGWTAYDGGEDCKTIHEYNVADLIAAIRTIRKEKA